MAKNNDRLPTEKITVRVSPQIKRGITKFVKLKGGNQYEVITAMFLQVLSEEGYNFINETFENKEE